MSSLADVIIAICFLSHSILITSSSPSSPHHFHRRHLSESKPNVIIIVIDDMPFLKQFSESAPPGVDLEGHTVEYADYPTPNLDAFRSEAVILDQSYCGGPKCSPSRLSLLTGRQPARNQWGIKQTLRTTNGSQGTDVTVDRSRLDGDDTIYNLPRVLQDNGYYTGMIGKWHLMPMDGRNYGCDALENSVDADLYDSCGDLIKSVGFDFVDSWYIQNIVSNDYFSHNPEWMVSRSQQFIDKAVDEEDKPFFLYFASTLAHSPDVGTALRSFSNTDSPKGTLFGDEVPDDTTMKSRDEIWTEAGILANGASTAEQARFAEYLWIDEMIGALIDYLKTKGIYDETFIVLQSDHGQEAKGLLYQQGSRIINIVRYPPLFGNQQTLVSSDLVVSNVDTAATIFDLVGATVPAQYTMDGVSWLDMLSTTNSDMSCCKYRFIDVYNSRSIVSDRYQYIFRANSKVDSAGNVDSLYPNTYDVVQFYDLELDPNQKHNVIAEYKAYRNTDSDGTLSSAITTFETKMRDYVTETCPRSDSECKMPRFTFCSEVIDAQYSWTGIRTLDTATMTIKLEESESLFLDEHSECGSNMEYSYQFVHRRRKLTVNLQYCCGDQYAIFPGDYVIPSGYSLSGDEGSLHFEDTLVSTNWNTMKIVSITCIVVVVCCILAVIGFGIMWRRRIKKKKNEIHSMNGKPAVVPSSSVDLNLDGGATPLADSSNNINVGGEMFKL